ncbi:hypothetical protein HYPSUDRAFT_202642 [Hypholoma sublateritium FD-334 SS-4]|uniref:DUF6589 domain-containing protein n=1 Tax=Hypholoma sublateritium (strain FD-334 SS-4) TaxID=945553 RepID=A0A0D2NSC5_HYPSF|nr:hypothetical protein HYPSUDRAFT_202642 [Hypholoma sublateritium FD-334 SS-4]
MIPRRPKTSAEILAGATYSALPVKTVPSQLLSAFSVDQTLPTENLPVAASETPEIPEEELFETPSFEFRQPITPDFFSAKDRGDMETGRARRSSDAVDSIMFSEDLSEFDMHSASPTGSASAPSMTRHDTCIDNILDLLLHSHISLFDLFLELLDESKAQYLSYQTEFYKEGSQKFCMILDRVSHSQNGRKKICTWIRHSCLQTVCEIVSEEMDEVKKVEKISGLSSITPEFIKSWTICDHADLAPWTTKILLAAAETSAACEKNKLKTPDAICRIIVKQLVYQRSFHSLGFQAQFGLFLWTTGCACQTIEALHVCRLSISYSSVLKTITVLGKHCMDLAIQASNDVHMFCYDNINLSTSIFTEQRRSDGLPKVTSGTFRIIYKLQNADPKDMEIAPIMERMQKLTGLQFNADLVPPKNQAESFRTQLTIVVVQVLTTHAKGFELYANNAELQHKPRHVIPPRYKTEQFPLRVTTIEEASLKGNLLYHDEVYKNLLKR